MGGSVLDLLRYDRDQMAETLKAAEAQPKRSAWRMSVRRFCAGN
ncbi:hypothetical protein J3D49_004536 [Pseudomonas kilonensis]|nr:hypothetical protein [Pseudomonas kilonensis]